MSPLTRLRPKVLCPVDGTALLDLALGRAQAVAARCAVNLHHGREAVEAHLADRDVHLSVEEPEALGTAGAVAAVAEWVGDAGLLVVNGDTWCPADLAPSVDGWDRERVRVVVAGSPELGARARIVGSLMPPDAVRSLRPEPTGLYEVCWGPLLQEGRLDVVGWEGPFVDCATPRDYLAANMAASGGVSVVGEGAVVDGVVERSVLWPGVSVAAGERLVDAIRASHEMTVLVR